MTAALFLPVALLLSGCVDLDMGIELYEDNTATMQMSLVDTGDMILNPEFGGSSCEDLMSEMEHDKDVSFTVKEFTTEDGQNGCRLEMNRASIEKTIDNSQIGGEESSITRDGDIFTVLLAADDEASQSWEQSAAFGMDMSLSLTFPGKVIEADGGEVSEDKRTVTWEGADIFSGIEATGEATQGSSLSILLWILAGLMVVGAAGVGAFLLLRSGKNDSAAQDPPGTHGAPQDEAFESRASRENGYAAFGGEHAAPAPSPYASPSSPEEQPVDTPLPAPPGYRAGSWDEDEDDSGPLPRPDSPFTPPH